MATSTCCTHSYCTAYTTDRSGLCAGHRPSEAQIAAAHENLSTRVKALAEEFPGLTFGYIGNCGFDRYGAFDDRSWRVFLPTSGRYRTFSDMVTLGDTNALPTVNWDKVETVVRRLYGHQRPRT